MFRVHTVWIAWVLGLVEHRPQTSYQVVRQPEGENNPFLRQSMPNCVFSCGCSTISTVIIIIGSVFFVEKSGIKVLARDGETHGPRTVPETSRPCCNTHRRFDTIIILFWAAQNSDVALVRALAAPACMRNGRHRFIKFISIKLQSPRTT